MDSRIHKMAHFLLHYSTRTQPGERVLIRSTSPAGEPLCQALYEEALRLGARPAVYIHMSEEDPIALEATTDPDLLADVNPMLKLMYEEAPVVIRIDAEENSRDRSAYPLELQVARAKARSALINVQMRREAAGELRCSTQPHLRRARTRACRCASTRISPGVQADLDDPGLPPGKRSTTRRIAWWPG